MPTNMTLTNNSSTNINIATNLYTNSNSNISLPKNFSWSQFFGKFIKVTTSLNYLTIYYCDTNIEKDTVEKNTTTKNIKKTKAKYKHENNLDKSNTIKASNTVNSETSQTIIEATNTIDNYAAITYKTLCQSPIFMVDFFKNVDIVPIHCLLNISNDKKNINNSSTIKNTPNSTTNDDNDNATNSKGILKAISKSNTRIGAEVFQQELLHYDISEDCIFYPKIITNDIDITLDKASKEIDEINEIDNKGNTQYNTSSSIECCTDNALNYTNIMDSENDKELNELEFNFANSQGKIKKFFIIADNSISKEQLENLALKITSETLSRLPTFFINYINLFNKLCVKKFLRDSKLLENNDLFLPLINYSQKYSKDLSKILDPITLAQVKLIQNLYPFDKNIEKIRQYHIEQQLVRRERFFNTVEKHPLTYNQRLAVIMNNDFNMVLAAAGTGKTSVMVAKALDLIDRGFNPKDILMLAYNKEAAIELQTRLDQRAQLCNMNLQQKVAISTFHSLGYSIVRSVNYAQQNNVSINVSELATNEQTKLKWVQKYLINYLMKDPHNIQNFLKLEYEAVDTMLIRDKNKYKAYLRDNSFITLKGESVKNHQELTIANWLFMHNVEYSYKEKYSHKKRIDVGVDYCPTFKIQDKDILDREIYLEHYEITRDGEQNSGDDEISIKNRQRKIRQIHEEFDSVLLETYYYDWKENKLEEKLAKLFSEQDIPFDEEINFNAILEILCTQNIKSKSKLKHTGKLEKAAILYKNALAAIRTERLDEKTVLSKLTKAKVSYPKERTKFLMDLVAEYTDYLKNNNEVDFDDMINQATMYIEQKEYIPTWKCILIDEFQDISSVRLDFIKAIYNHSKEQPVLTVVGDDWQSIYRFNGGKLEATTNFEQYMGQYSLTKLDKSYRYNNNIAKLAGEFIMKNPTQFKKEISTLAQINEPSVDIYEVDYYRNSLVAPADINIVNSYLSKESELVVIPQVNSATNNANNSTITNNLPINDSTINDATLNTNAVNQTLDNIDNTNRQLQLSENSIKSNNYLDIIDLLVQNIRTKYPNDSIAILARNNFYLEDIKQYLLQNNQPIQYDFDGYPIYPNNSIYNNIIYWTFHRAKGREADHCILVGFISGELGFPNQRRDEAIIEALLPSLDKYEHSEERRLFYVALTRAKKHSYILSDVDSPSVFVDEILHNTKMQNLVNYVPLDALDAHNNKHLIDTNDSDNLDDSSTNCNTSNRKSTDNVSIKDQIKRTRKVYKCPKCGEILIAQKGQYDIYYFCPNKGCQMRYRACEKCKSPSIDTRFESKCINKECKHAIKICPDCGRPMKLRTSGNNNEFWGCSGYGLGECDYTENLDVIADRKYLSKKK